MEKRKLVIGLSDRRHVEVKDGVRAGEAVLINPQTERAVNGGPGAKQSRGQSRTDVIVRSVKPTEAPRTRVATYGLTFQDYERLEALSTITRLLPLRIFPHEVRRLEHSCAGRIVATRPEYAAFRALEFTAGRFLTDEDDLQMENVAVLGASAARELFPREDPLGQTVRLGGQPYVVVGILGDRPPASSGRETEEFNRDVYIPLRTCKARFGERIALRHSGSWTIEAVQLSQVLVSVASQEQVRPTMELITNQLRRAHTQNDWAVQEHTTRQEG